MDFFIVSIVAAIAMAIAVIMALAAVRSSIGKRTPSSVEPPEIPIPDFEPPEIDLGKDGPKRFIDPFSGEPLRDDCGTIVLVSGDGERHDYEVNSDTAATFRAKGLYPFREKMRLLVGAPADLYCYRGGHGRNDLDELSTAYLSGELFGGYRASFDLAFDDLAARQSRDDDELDDGRSAYELYISERLRKSG